MSQQAKLEAEITAAADAYYNSQPIMSDAAFDALQDELRRIAPSSPVLAQVGAKPKGSLPKVRHGQPMGSLAKCYTEAEFMAWYAKTGGTARLVVSEKLDGMSLSLRYEGGKLVQALTRGDGIEGEDVTANALRVHGVPRTLPAGWEDFSGYVRGEAVVSKRAFADLFRIRYKNTRGAVMGLVMGGGSPRDMARVDFIAFALQPDGEGLSMRSAERFGLRVAGFDVVESTRICRTPRDIASTWQHYASLERERCKYDIDGLVVEIDDTETREALGDVDMRPRGAIAWKFEAEASVTSLRSVEWQTAASGRVSPVAVFDPVDLAGATVGRATLHSLKFVRQLNADAGREEPEPFLLRAGDRILVSRRGDVIPQVERVVECSEIGECFFIPGDCPACGEETREDGAFLVCRNDDCHAQVAGAIRRWVQRVGVLQCGPAFIEALVDAGFVRDIADLYTVDLADAMAVELDAGRKAGASAVKALGNLHAKRTLDLHTFIAALGIAGIGPTLARAVVDAGFDTIHKLINCHQHGFEDVQGFGIDRSRNFARGLDKAVPLIERILAAGVVIKPPATGPMAGKSMCVTGFRDAELAAAFEAAGGTVKSGVSKGLTYLVALDPGATSGKLTKAREYGTQIVSVDDMRRMLAEG